MKKTLASFAAACLTVAFAVPLAVPMPARAADPADKTLPVFDAATLQKGRGVVALLRRRNAAALSARFTSEMASVLPPAQAAKLVAGLSVTAAPLEESVDYAAAKPTTYTARLQTPSGDAFLTLSFRGDKIAYFLATPAPPLSPIVRAAVRQAGRRAAALVETRNAAALHARFTPGFAAYLAEPELASLLAQASDGKRAQAAPFTDAVTRDANGLPEYTAVVPGKAGQNTAIQFTFIADDAKQITGLLLQPSPRMVLPVAPHAGYRTRAVYRLPFALGEAWMVGWGGDTREQNYHVDYPDQRHAFDFVVTRAGATHTGAGKTNTDYFAWNQVVRAPASGTVVAATDAIADNAPGVMRPETPFGNCVVIACGHGEYAVLAHLKHGSVAVRVGQKVAADTLIGRCGNSGNTTEPHLHFHLQDAPSLAGNAHGLPVRFTGYTANGKPVTAGLPVRGETVLGQCTASGMRLRRGVPAGRGLF